MVGDMCSMPPYGTGICCSVVLVCLFICLFVCLFFALLLSILLSFSCLILFFFFFNLDLINRRNGPRYQRVLALCAFFFNTGDTEGTNSSKILFLTFVYVLFYVNLCRD